MPTAEVTVPAGGLIIVEGVSALALEVVERVGQWWDLSFWIECNEATRRARIAERDGEASLDLWEQSWWPSERHYVATQDPESRADFTLLG